MQQSTKREHANAGTEIASRPLRSQPTAAPNVPVPPASATGQPLAHFPISISQQREAPQQRTLQALSAEICAHAGQQTSPGAPRIIGARGQIASQSLDSLSLARPRVSTLWQIKDRQGHQR